MRLLFFDSILSTENMHRIDWQIQKKIVDKNKWEIKCTTPFVEVAVSKLCVDSDSSGYGSLCAFENEWQLFYRKAKNSISTKLTRIVNDLTVAFGICDKQWK